MENLKRSICSTCRHLTHCVLTTDKSNISSCSDYVHRLEKDYVPLPKEPIEMFSSSGQGRNKEIVINY